MKKIWFLLAILAMIFAYSCEEANDPGDNTGDSDSTGSILPESMVVELPSSISSNQVQKSSSTEALSGREMYANLRLFIHVGESSAQVVNEIMTAIRVHHIARVVSLDYKSDDDDRLKHAEVTEDVIYEGRDWEYELLVTDDGNKALQVVWNTDPVEGIAIMNPYQINREENPEMDNVRYEIYYSEAGDEGYEQAMEVKITGLPLKDTYSIDNLKMFAGKNGDVIDIHGNSNHPGFKIIDTTYTGGRNYAFVARSNRELNISVAKIALPPSSVSTIENIFEEYSIKNVIKRELEEEYAGLISIYPAAQDTLDAMVDLYTAEAEPPGYFDAGGFISNADSIPDNEGFTEEFMDLSGMQPYVPFDIKNLIISFLEE